MPLNHMRLHVTAVVKLRSAVDATEAFLIENQYGICIRESSRAFKQSIGQEVCIMYSKTYSVAKIININSQEEVPPYLIHTALRVSFVAYFYLVTDRIAATSRVVRVMRVPQLLDFLFVRRAILLAIFG